MIPHLSDSSQQSGRLDAESEGVVSKHPTFQACVSISCQFSHAFELARALVPTPARIIAELCERDRALELRSGPPGPAGPARQKAPPAQGPRY